MPQFLVAKSSRRNGLFEVHEAGCAQAPPQSHVLGHFPSAARAVSDARALYPRCEACGECCGVTDADAVTFAETPILLAT